MESLRSREAGMLLVNSIVIPNISEFSYSMTNQSDVTEFIRAGNKRYLRGCIASFARFVRLAPSSQTMLLCSRLLPKCI